MHLVHKSSFSHLRHNICQTTGISPTSKQTAGEWSGWKSECEMICRKLMQVSSLHAPLLVLGYERVEHQWRLQDSTQCTVWCTMSCVVIGGHRDVTMVPSSPAYHPLSDGFLTDWEELLQCVCITDLRCVFVHLKWLFFPRQISTFQVSEDAECIFTRRL